ncbi:MAG: glucosaminidase domain-containing protein [Desulfuromonadales bacterium]|jgi:Bax protein
MILVRRISLFSALTCSGLVLLTGTFSLAAYAAQDLGRRPDVETIRPETTTGMQTFFEALDYEWSALEQGVPPLILQNIPHDIAKTSNLEAKKQSFFMGLLPMVLLANQEIRQERAQVLEILQKHRAGQLQDDDRARLNAIMQRYELRGRPLVDHRTRSTLLRRVDTIPPSLVLAQAANESAWGTSRFARLGNNLFGEWTFKPGSGIVPEDRPSGAIYEVRKFPSLYESIRSYMKNLNTHSAYRKLRQIRERLRQSGQAVTGIALAHGLSKYSQRGAAYVTEIQAMIRQNSLAKANQASLRLPGETAYIPVSTAGAGLFSSRSRMIGHTPSLR